jgi:hypothetical protein
VDGAKRHTFTARSSHSAARRSAPDYDAGLGRSTCGKPSAVEEPQGTRKDRLARVVGRGREDAAPVALHFGVVGAVAALVLVILVVAMVVWVLIR